MNIREAVADDSRQISELIYKTAEPLSGIDFTVEGWDGFSEAVAEERICEQIVEKNKDILVYEIDDQIIGILNVSGRRQINMFFVHPEYQGNGIGRELWQEANRNYNLEQIKVFSSTTAVISTLR